MLVTLGRHSAATTLLSTPMRKTVMITTTNVLIANNASHTSTPPRQFVRNASSCLLLRGIRPEVVQITVEEHAPKTDRSDHIFCKRTHFGVASIVETAVSFPGISAQSSVWH